MHKQFNKSFKFHPAFTIVELLVVIVVIGVLASISLVAYTGVSRKATEAAVVSDLTNTTKQFKIFQIENSNYPADIELNCTTPVNPANKCMKLSGGNTLGKYTVSNTPGSQTFCLTIKNGTNIIKHIDQDGTIADNACTYAFPSAIATNNPVPTTNTITLSWAQVADAQSFELERATDSNFTTNKQTLTVSSPTATNYIDSTGLSQGTTYYYRLRVTMNGDTSNWGLANATTKAVYTLTVNVNNAAYGTATGGGTFDSGTVRTITATPIGLYVFSNWSGTGCSTGTVTMDANKTCTANFTLDPNWIAVGTQIWAKANLNVGTRIAGTTNQTNNAVLEKYCYNDTESNCTTYGALYQWNEAMQYVTTAGARGICPVGSHIPTDNDWKILEVYLGMTQAQADIDYAWRGTDQGTKLKSGGVSGLNVPLAGYYYDSGVFGNLSSDAGLWSSSESGTNAYDRFLRSGITTVCRNAYPKGYGMSVRCLGN